MLRDLYICKDFVWELLDRVIYKTLYGNPLNFSKIYDIVMNDEIKLTQNRQVHAEQEVGQLYFIIHNNIIYF